MNAKTLTLVTTLLLLCTVNGCATLSQLENRIPGLDRLTHHFSKAEVGPVVTKEGEVVAGTEPEPVASAPNAAEIPAASEKEVADAIPSGAAKVAKPSLPPVKRPKTEKIKHAESATQSAQVPAQRVPSPAAPAKPKPADASTPRPSYPAPREHASPSYALSGTVTVLSNKGQIPSEGVIARLERQDGKPIKGRHNDNKEATHIIDMEKKVYLPGQIVIRKGDSVNFVNKDAIQHNVFSSSGTNAFDLGTFGGGLQRAVRLNDEGIVKVYCNIHPKMATFVAVDDHGQSKILNEKDSSFKFSDLDAGVYKLTLWSIRGEKSFDIELGDQPLTHLALTLDTSAYQEQSHPNKFGEQYKKTQLRREFY